MLWWSLWLPTTFENLDPIHLIPTVSKSLEKIVDNKSADHLESVLFYDFIILCYLLTTGANRIDKAFSILGHAWAVA